VNYIPAPIVHREIFEIFHAAQCSRQKKIHEILYHYEEVTKGRREDGKVVKRRENEKGDIYFTYIHTYIFI